MMEASTVVGLCRCCQSEAGARSINEPYTHEGAEEIYSVMLQDTFEIFLRPLRLESAPAICTGCVSELRAAAGFKRRVLDCEARLMTHWKQFDVKKEESEPFPNAASDTCFDVKNDSGADRVSGSDDDQPLASLARDKSEDYTKNDEKKRVKNYHCNHCSKGFTYKGSLEIHLKAHRGEKTLPCLLCKTKYCSHKELNQHMTEKHYNGQTYNCQICPETFKHSKLLKHHINTHFRDRFRCELCSKVFPRKKGLDSHLKTHTGEKQYTCNVCNKSFGHNQTLKVHMYIHTGEKPHVCHECGNSFTQSNHLKRHIIRIHRGIKKYPCTICHKKFSSKTYMLTHESLHKGGKPFSCQICNKDFTLYTSLRVHLKLHEGLKPFSCSYCSRNFAQMASLKLHERSHTGEKPFSCAVCKKPFSDNGYLKIHMRVHTGDRPYQCGACKRSFREKGQLKRHMRTHTGEKYSCAICNKQVSNLTKHMKVHAVKSGANFGGKIDEKGTTCKICHKQCSSNTHIKLNEELKDGFPT